MQIDCRSALRLFQVIFWQEIRRKKIYIFFMIMALVLTCFMLLPGHSNSDFDFRFEYQGETPYWLQSMFFPEMMALTGVLFKISPALILGLIIACILPWRSKEEWEQGLLQMWTLSPWKPLIWECFRTLCFFAVILIYYIVLFSCMTIALNERIQGNTVLIISTIKILSLIALTVLPFFIGLSVLLTALRAAYRHQSKTWTISVMLVISWWVVVSHGFRFLLKSSNDPNGYFFQPWDIKLQHLSALNPTIYWYPEWVIGTFFMSGIMVYLAGRIYEEIEVY